MAPYACGLPAAYARAHAEPDDPLRSPFERDRHRIIESTAFRRLEHKTQVFAPAHHDHFRTRLTHTLEATQIARCLARALGVHEALAESITLAHDLGHPPFGHAGEKALDECMADSGGFNHNAHTLRVIEYLEHPYPAFRGLNLTAATRAGLMAHTTQYDVPIAGDAAPQSSKGLLSVEAQIASLADRIAYNIHDLEDAIGAEYVTEPMLNELRLWVGAGASLDSTPSAPNIHALRRGVLDTMLDGLIGDAVTVSRRRLKPVRSFNDVISATAPLVALSSGADDQLAELERFLFEQAYRHPEIVAGDAAGQTIIRALFAAYRADATRLPPRFSARVDEQGLDRVIGDYIAGMTDRFCTRDHNRLAQS